MRPQLGADDVFRDMGLQDGEFDKIAFYRHDLRDNLLLSPRAGLLPFARLIGRPYRLYPLDNVGFEVVAL